jgi:hypothetical protein
MEGNFNKAQPSFEVMGEYKYKTENVIIRERKDNMM